MTISRQILCLLALAGPIPATAVGAEQETRHFSISIDGKPAGSYALSIHHDQGTFTVTGNANVRHRVLIITYTYTYNGKEVWKDGRLQSLDSQTNDDGKQFAVSARAEGNALRVTSNGQQRLTRPDVWTTSYWRLAPVQFRNQTAQLIDADTGRDIAATLQYVGLDPARVCGTVQNYSHYRVTGGGLRVDVWYDASEQMVRQESIEEGHRTVLELLHVAK